MILRGKGLSVVKTELYLIFNKSVNLLYYEGKSFNEVKQLMISENEYNTKRPQIYLKGERLLFLLFTPFAWRET